MRTLLIAGTAIAGLVVADAAVAGERMVQPGPGISRGGWNAPRAMPGPPTLPQIGQHGGSRWGSKVGGRWWGGANAPGGWNAYRRPVRGYALPAYWNTPRFYISDWSAYGLAQPQSGYNWVRYYDDAVLIDGRGSVYDTVGQVDWDRYDGGSEGGYGYEDDQVYARDDDRYAPPPPPPAPAYRDDRGHRERYERRDNGVGGAVAGAAAGGIAGALIGGRHNRVGGALIGGGVGALTGYAIDKAEYRRGPPPPPRGYGAGYPTPGYGRGYPPPPPPYPPAPGGHWVSPDGTTTVVTSGGGWGGSTTTVTVQTAPVVTTTTTEIYEDNVTWSRHAPKRKVWKPRRKVVCRCQ